MHWRTGPVGGYRSNTQALTASLPVRLLSSTIKPPSQFITTTQPESCTLFTSHWGKNGVDLHQIYYTKRSFYVVYLPILCGKSVQPVPTADITM